MYYVVEQRNHEKCLRIHAADGRYYAVLPTELLPTLEDLREMRLLGCDTLEEANRMLEAHRGASKEGWYSIYKY